jgi:molybdenum cofactor guanylyltransferase
MDAVILAGGAGRRLGGAAKPTLPVAGRPMLMSVLDAVADSPTRVVVGPAGLDRMLPAGVVRLQEQPPGGGPVAALAAGVARLDGADRVALLAADLPLLTPAAIAVLERALDADPESDGAAYVDDDGRPQWLCGVWRAASLRRRLAAVAARGPLAGQSMRDLFGPLQFVAVRAPADAGPPWYDCDTAEDLAAAECLGGPREGQRHGHA